MMVMNRRKFLQGTGVFGLLAVASAADSDVTARRQATETAPFRIDLSGQWACRIDPNGVGLKERWFAQKLNEPIRLPGTTDQAKIGKPQDRGESALSRRHAYKGPVWYQRDIVIPKGWQGKKALLFLERTKHSQAWVDVKPLGALDSLCTPHEYSLGMLSPGSHRLTLCINNADLPPIGGSYQISDDTQTNWNGVIGRMEIRAEGAAHIRQVQIYPDTGLKKARLAIRVQSGTYPFRGAVRIRVLQLGDKDNQPLLATEAPCVVSSAGQPASLNLELGSKVKSWSEFDPALYELSVVLQETPGGEALDAWTGKLAVRSFSTIDTHFAINGWKTFLRGKHDACVFPLTGYPPMDVEGWLRVFETAKSYGINHYRFHSWCPPEAAFDAADRLGIYLQPEMPNTAPYGVSEAHDSFLMAEGLRILDTYGNHPSFAMLSLGNELGGSRAAMRKFVRAFRRHDPRHLYVQGSNNFYWSPSFAEGDDYWTTFRTGLGLAMVRGSFSNADLPLGHIQSGPPDTLAVYDQAISRSPVPVIGHEVGEYQVYPDFKEIDQYTGVLAPLNLESFRKRAQSAGVLGRNKLFQQATGKLAVICYREEVESALRTAGFGGFQLLDLQDFPGQGTALIGILNAFMESKGLIDPAQWREFCAPTVPLLEMRKYCWRGGETFEGRVKLAHYGRHDLRSAVLDWRVLEANGATLRSGSLAPVEAEVGTLTDLGRIEFGLPGSAGSRRLEIVLSLPDGQAANRYPVWVFNPPSRPVPAGKATVVNKLGPAELASLRAGGSYLLISDFSALARPQAYEGFFTPDFWCYPMFRDVCLHRREKVAPGTLGLLCDPRHPCLRGFPTAFHTDWQWFNILRRSRALNLDSMPADYQPIVEIVDNISRAHRLGLIFEVRVGQGRLLVCSADLLSLTDHPEAPALLNSLHAYAASSDFNPTHELSAELLSALSKTHS